MKYYEIPFPKDTNKAKIRLWVGHQHTSKTPPLSRLRVCIFPIFATFNFNLMYFLNELSYKILVALMWKNVKLSFQMWVQNYIYNYLWTTPCWGTYLDLDLDIDGDRLLAGASCCKTPAEIGTETGSSCIHQNSPHPNWAPWTVILIPCHSP